MGKTHEITTPFTAELNELVRVADELRRGIPFGLTAAFPELLDENFQVGALTLHKEAKTKTLGVIHEIEGSCAQPIESLQGVVQFTSMLEEIFKNADNAQSELLDTYFTWQQHCAEALESLILSQNALIKRQNELHKKCKRFSITRLAQKWKVYICRMWKISG